MTANKKTAVPISQPDFT